jgi:hypothetical protein
MASGTDGEILTYDASGNPTSVSVGTDGQVLTSTGAGSPPAFEAAAGGGATEADTWVLTASYTGNAQPLSANLARDTSDGFGLLGTGMSVSSGIWSFPSTGYWQVSAYFMYKVSATQSRYLNAVMEFTPNNGTSWDSTSQGKTHMANIPSTTYANHTFTKILDITDISNQKIKFMDYKFVSTIETFSQSPENATCFTFIRLGDT